ncbi:MAG TPA: hypothetical protein PKZ32_01845 [Candidatus Melainabacteria bacterium]|nr:hypothetical protein [Candidatus Melainabacteria bacterium]
MPIYQKLTLSPRFLVGYVLALTLMLLALTGCPANAQQAEPAAIFEGKRTAHKVRGWEHGLIKKTPNLSNYYWTPLTQYTQGKGARRTGKGVRAAERSKQLTRHYVKPRFAPLPGNGRSADTNETSREVSAKLRFDKAKNQLASGRPSDSATDCAAVLTYGDREKGEGYSYKRQNLAVTGRLYGQKKKTTEQ